MRESLFHSQNSQSDKIYLKVRNDERYLQQKRYLENLWEAYKPFSDPNYQQEFSKQFHARLWEMHLTCLCLDQGFHVKERSSNTSEGPDIHILQNGRNIWIEAVTATPGMGKDALTECVNAVRDYPQNQIILRFTNSLKEKKYAIQKYLKSGIIQPQDIILIAINGGSMLHDVIRHDGVPLIVKSVFAIGLPTISFHDNGKFFPVISEGYSTNESIVKEEGGIVSTSCFVNNEYSDISGILYSNVNYQNINTIPKDEIITIHNPKAKNQLHHFVFPGKHYFYNIKKSEIEMRYVS